MEGKGAGGGGRSRRGVIMDLQSSLGICGDKHILETKQYSYHFWTTSCNSVVEYSRMLELGRYSNFNISHTFKALL